MCGTDVRQMLLATVLLASLSKCSFAQGNATYVVVAPQIVRAGSTYDVTVTIFRATSSVTVDVSLVTTRIVTADGSAGVQELRKVTVATNITTVSEGSTTTASLQIPSMLSELHYTLDVQGTGGNSFNETRTVFVARKTLSIFVQTDKAMYKPNQPVLFRVITVYPDLKPFTKEINVTITDNAGNKIAQWINQRNDTGVFSNSLQLSDQPPLGAWTITVSAKRNTVTKKFIVAEYVLPKFEVTVDLPSYFLLLRDQSKQQNLPITVIATYTYGQPVRGRADILVTIKPYGTYDRNRYGSKSVNVELVEGKADVVVTIAELVAMLPSNIYRPNNTWSNLQYRAILVTADVTEAATGTTLSGNNTVQCTSTKYVLSFLEITPTNFKPDLSVSAYLQLKQFDGAPPLPADIQSNPINVTVAYDRPYYYYMPTTDSYYNDTSTWNLTVPVSGIVNFTVPASAARRTISITATFHDTASYTTAEAYKTIQKFNSRGNDGIQVLLKNINGLIEAGQTAVFTVTTTQDVTYFYYQMVSKGVHILSGSHTGSPSTQHELSIPIDGVLAQKLAPKARIIVWCITHLDEMISDALDFTVIGAFANEVSVSFSNDTVRPADTVSFTVAAHPASYVGLLAVDQSVLLLRQGNDITRDSVLHDLSSYEFKAPSGYYPSPPIIVDPVPLPPPPVPAPATRSPFTPIATARPPVGPPAPAPSTRPPIPPMATSRPPVGPPAPAPSTRPPIPAMATSRPPVGPPATADPPGPVQPPGQLPESPVAPLAPALPEARRLPVFFWFPYYSGGTNSYEVFKNAGVLVMTDAYIERRRYFEKSPPVGGPPGPGQAPGPGPAGPAPGPAPAPAPGPGPSAGPDDGNRDLASDTANNVRSNFPETWIWTEAVAGADGQTTMTATIPDTITSWVLSAFAVHSDVGLGVASERAEITAFKPFFISLTLPYSIIRGEEFALQATVFNYLSTPLQATVTLKKSDYFKVRVPNVILPQKRTVSAPVKVTSKNANSAYFWIVPETLGQIPIEVSVVYRNAGDSVRRMLLVEPEGIPSEYSTSTFISLSPGETYSGTFKISLPADGELVPGSEYIEVTVIGTLMGQSLDGLGKLLKMPYGCAEQNMLHFAPDVYILKYFEATGQTAGSIVTKAKRFINAGYQRELTYQRSDGSFSAFGNRDKSGSVWLSAFVAKCFHEARDFIPVDDTKIAAILHFLMINQAPSGSFPETGRVRHTAMQGGSARGVALTAYVVITLLENSDNVNVSSSFQRSLNRSVEYLESELRSAAPDPYALSIITYALTLAGSSQANIALQELNKLATSEDGFKYWHKARSDDSTMPIPGRWRAPYQRARSVDIEMTAYALLTYTRRRDVSGAVPIAKWIVSQRNSLGGFSSTQDTVVALQALAEYAALTSGNDPTQNLAITVAADTLTHSFTITSLNALVLQSVQIPSTATTVSLEATGSGVGLVQLNVKYYYYGTNGAVGQPPKNIELNVTQEQVHNASVTVRSCAKWRGSEVSGMAIVETGVLTGYVAANVNELKSQSGAVKRVDSSESKIVLYLDELTANATCFEVKQSQSMIVDNVQPASVSAYLYYDPREYDTIVYQPAAAPAGSTRCDRCPSCCQSGCEVWSPLYNSHVHGGVMIATALTVEECKDTCVIMGSSCNGIDWDSILGLGEQCWLHGRAWSGRRAIGTATGVTHYDLSRICELASPTGCTSWIPMAHTNVLGGVRGSVETLSECMDACVENVDCIGIDWNYASEADRRCWLTVDGSRRWRIGIAPHIMHFNLTRDVSCRRTVCNHWIPMKRTNVVGGVRIGAATLSDCKEACLDNIDCIGFDWNRVATLGKSCWLTVTQTGQWRIGVAPGITHYNLTRDDSCRRTDDCTWAKMPRTNVLGGVKVVAKTLSVCQDACIDNMKCDGFDWNDVAAAGESCWLSGPWSGQWRIDIAPDITHYNLTCR